MKKLVSLLLTGCMILGLAACGNTTTPESSVPSSSAPSSSAPESSVPSSSVVEEEVNPFEGAEIEVWGLAPNAIEPENANVAYTGLVAAALDEWCAENGVTLKFMGAYNQDAVMAAIAGGESPDLILHYNIFPKVANLGLVTPVSEEAYQEMNKIAGTSAFTDAWSTKGECYGFQMPMQGSYLLRYNWTVFEQYGVKTPKEYWQEGNWTWDTMLECAKAVTKDLDDDGTNDTYGFNITSLGNLVRPNTEAPDGKLTSNIDSDEYRRYVDIMYNGVLEGYIVNTQDGVTKADNPRPLMEITAVANWELNNFFRKDKTTEEFFECVPMPGYASQEDSSYALGNYGLAKCAGTDASEAVDAAMCYVMQALIAGISEISLGNIPCEYEFLKGTTPLSAKVLELYGPYKEKIAAAKDYPIYDVEYFAEVNEFIKKPAIWAKKTYAGVSISLDEILKEPPATSIAKLIETYQAKLDTYNNLYVY